MGGVQPVVRRGGPHSLSLVLKVGNLMTLLIGLGWGCSDGLPLLPHHLLAECMMSLKSLIIHGGCQLRVGSWNVRSMKGRDGELADMAGRRRLDLCCFQETKWKGKGVKLLGEKGKRYKLWWRGGGGKDGFAVGGVLVAQRWVEGIVELK